MRNFTLRVLVLSFSLALASGESPSRLAAVFSRIQGGASASEAFAGVDLSALSLPAEEGTLLAALKSGDPRAAKAAAASSAALLYLHPDAASAGTVRRLMPALAAHYDDPDPDQPAGISAPTDFWRQKVMALLSASNAQPGPELLGKIEADAYRTGDAYGGTARIAWNTLAGLRPLPDDVARILLDGIRGPAPTKLAVIEALGRSRVSDAPAVSALIQALEGGTEIRRAAVVALGEIGAPAKGAVHALEGISHSFDPSFTPEEREDAARALRAIQTGGVRN